MKRKPWTVKQGRPKVIMIPCTSDNPCGRPRYIRPRPLYRSLGKFMFILVREWDYTKKDWLHHSKVKDMLWETFGYDDDEQNELASDYADLANYGLMHLHPDREGFYKPTKGGYAFAWGRIKIPVYYITKTGVGFIQICKNSPKEDIYKLMNAPGFRLEDIS